VRSWARVDTVIAVSKNFKASLHPLCTDDGRGLRMDRLMSDSV